MIEFGMRFKETFFDRAAVLGAVDKARRKALSRAGAFVRRTAKGLIRKRKRSARPGQPPTSWTGLLKDFIFFGYDSGTGTVVIGPTKLGGKEGNTPQLLEFGGTTRLKRSRRFSRGRRVVELDAGAVAHYRSRPYMGPALEKESAKLPGLWADSVRG